MSLDEFRSLIEKHFTFLFGPFGGRISHSRVRNASYEDYSVGIDAPGFRVIFQKEEGGFPVFVGPPDAPFDNQEDWLSKGNWVNIHGLLRYLTGKKTDWTELETMPFEERVTKVYSVTAETLAPLCPRIAEMFSSPQALSLWKPGYDSYVRERLNDELRGRGPQ